MSLAWIHDALAARRRAGLDRSPPRLDGVGPRVLLDGQPILNFCNNDYLGLGGDAGSRAVLAAAAAEEPAGATASRLVAGDLPAHRAAERALADYLDRDDAVLFPSGYAANTGTLAALAGPGDVVLSDALNHASHIDGIRLSRAHVLVYRHRDAQHAADLAAAHARRAPVRRWLIATDALFSMDADEAPLEDLADLSRQLDAALLIDEAHSLGILGPAGRGLCARERVRPDILIGTLGKAFGLAGAFAACDAATARWLRATARSFVYSTATLPALARAISQQVPRVAAADDRRARALAHGARIRAALDSPPCPPGCIVPWVLGSPDAAVRASAMLLERGLFAQPIRPPTVPPGTSRLRLVATAAHDEADVTRLCDAIHVLRNP